MIPHARLRQRPLRALLYYAQRLVVWLPLRDRIASAGAIAIRTLYPRRKPAPTSLLTDLEQRGYAMIEPSLLTSEAIDEMVRYLSHHTPHTHLGRADYELGTVLHCPHVIETANHPVLLNLAAAFLGCAPTISSVGLRWTYPAVGDAADPVMQYHRDADDWRFFKFFTYLTDVTEDTGPHVFVCGSHLKSGRIRARPYTQTEILKDYAGHFNVHRIIGPRGTMFVANTAGVHKGEYPQSAPRLLFEVGYSLLPIYAFDYRPQWLPRLKVDPYINRLLVQSKRPF